MGVSVYLVNFFKVVIMMLCFATFMTLLCEYSKINEKLENWGDSKKASTLPCLYYHLIRIGDPYFNEDCSSHSNLATNASKLKGQSFPKRKSRYFPIMTQSYFNSMLAHLKDEYESAVAEVKIIIDTIWPETDDVGRPTKYEKYKEKIAKAIIYLLSCNHDDRNNNERLFKYTVKGLCAEKEISLEEILIEAWVYICRHATSSYEGDIKELVENAFESKMDLKLRVYGAPVLENNSEETTKVKTQTSDERITYNQNYNTGNIFNFNVTGNVGEVKQVVNQGNMTIHVGEDLDE